MDNEMSNSKLEKQINAYLEGKLSESEAQALWAELIKRPEYIEHLQTEIDLTRFYRQSNKQDSGIGQYWQWAAAAAAVILIVIGLNIFSSNGLKDYTIQTIHLRESLATTVTMRSAETNFETVDSLLKLGFEKALNGNINKALAIYSKVIANHPHSVYAGKAHLNVGILKYNAGEYRNAVSNLQKALSIIQKNLFIKEQAHWYLGNAFINIGKFKEAKEALNTVYQMKGQHAQPAKRLLKRISQKLASAE